jgi:uncharacterized protein
MILQYLGVLIIGIIVGFLGGLFGKGGSAIATPMLSLIGIPGFISVTSPLPATIPGTFIASVEYWKSDLIDWQIVKWSLIVGVPSTILGAYLTSYTGAIPLLILTGLLVLTFGLGFLIAPREKKSDSFTHLPESAHPRFWRLRLVLVSLFVGLISGLLANSGGFLLAPSYSRILHLPLKKAFACSLFVSMFLAIPGTIVHAYLGHINWLITGVLALGSVPFSFLGARTAIRTESSRLERWYGLILTALGIFFIIKLF